MKKSLLTFFLCIAYPLLLPRLSFLHSQNWSWAKNTTLNIGNSAHSLASDKSGNFYLQAIDSNGVSCIIKFDTYGNEIWKKYLPGIQINDVASSDSNLYIIGNYQGTIQFSNTVLTSLGNSDIFLSCFTLSGNFSWAKSIGGKEDESGNKICTDNSGNVYMVGNYSDTLFSENSFIISSGYTTMFLSEYSPQGNLLLLKSGGSNDSSALSYGRWVQVDPVGNIYIGGTFNDLLLDTFYIADGSEYYNEYSIPGFLCKLKPDGTALWLKEINMDYEQMCDMALCGNTIYQTGQTFSWHADKGIIKGFSTSTGMEIYNSTSGGCFEWCNAGMNAVADGNFYTIGYSSDDSPPNYPNNHYLLLGGSQINCDADIYASDIVNLSTGGPVICGLMKGNLNLGNHSLYAPDYSLFIAGTNTSTFVENFSIQEEVQILPNPTNGKLTFISETPYKEIRIFDSHGQLTNSLQFENSRAMTDISSQPKGIYFAEFTSENKRITKKIVLE